MATITCLQCSATFRNRQGLVVHSRIHTNELPFACTVDGCSDRFRSSTARARHVKTCHVAPDEKVACPDCGVMLRPLSVQAHQRLKHRDVHPELKPPPTHTCPVCSRSFPLRGNLRRHMQHVHATDRVVFGCRLCPVTRFTEQAARNHMVKCAKKYGVEVPTEGPIQRHKNMAVPLRGGGSAKRVAPPQDEGECLDSEACTRAAMSKRQRTAEIAACRSVAEEERKHAAAEGELRCPFHDGMVYRTAEQLALHQRQHARLKGKYMCHHCGVQPNLLAVDFLTGNKLRHHVRQYHADVIRAHSAEIEAGMDVLAIPAAKR